MAWVKLDDAMPHHPKVMAAGPQAFALDVAGICYSNKHGTDGFIPESSLAAVYPALSNSRKWARKLVDVGRWVEVDGGWRIHDVADYQPSAAEQKELARKRAEAGRRGGQAKAKQTTADVEAKPEANAKQVASGVLNPVPARPGPSPSKHSDQTGSNGSRELPAGTQESILDLEPRFRQLRRRERWPDYQLVLNEWSDLGPPGLAEAVGEFCRLSSEGYADTPKLLRSACEKVATRSTPDVSEPEFIREFKL